jgi:hypothetical protein
MRPRHCYLVIIGRGASAVRLVERTNGSGAIVSMRDRLLTAAAVVFGIAVPAGFILYLLFQ